MQPLPHRPAPGLDRGDWRLRVVPHLGGVEAIDAGTLARHALASPGGERFMLIAAGLEYISSGPGAGTPVEAEPAGESEEHREAGDDDSDDSPDLAEAGEDYLSEQGFDRRS